MQISRTECNQTLSNGYKMYSQNQFSPQIQITYKWKRYKKFNTGLLHEALHKPVDYLTAGTHVQRESFPSVFV
jgi:hypothetical protein